MNKENGILGNLKKMGDRLTKNKEEGSGREISSVKTPETTLPDVHINTSEDQDLKESNSKRTTFEIQEIFLDKINYLKWKNSNLKLHEIHNAIYAKFFEDYEKDNGAIETKYLPYPLTELK